MTTINVTREEVQEKLRKGPYHQWLGLEVTSVGDGNIELTAKWREEWVVNVEGGYTHGGILAALVDLTADWALVSKTGKGVPTIDLRVDYHRAAKGDLRATGKVIKFGKQFSVAEASVFDGEGNLVASGRGVFHARAKGLMMMATPQIPLDHIVINSRFETDAAAALLGGLGFTLTPRGYHTLGSINHLMVFADNYLEIIGLPPDVPVQRKELLDSPVGIDGLVFAISDAEACHATLAQDGVATHPVQHFSRPLTIDGAEQQARFSVVRLLPGQFEAGRVYFCHHLTPELVWRKEWQQHANGVTDIAGLTIVSHDPDATAAQYARLGADANGDDRARNQRFTLDVISQETFAQRVGDFADIGAGRAERFALISVRCADAAVAAGLAAGVSLPYRATPGRTLVAIPAFSALIEFIDASAQ